MKGIVFNVLEHVIRGEQSEAAWDRLPETAGSDGVYPSLASYPDDGFHQFFAWFQSPRGFILSLNRFIHPEVRKMHPGAEAPNFEFSALEPGRLEPTHRSRRKPGAFALGLAEGSAGHHDPDRCRLNPRFIPRG